MIIKNIPKEAYRYEFIVVRREDNSWIYHSHHTNGFIAAKIAKGNPDILVVHNVRIQGYKED